MRRIDWEWLLICGVAVFALCVSPTHAQDPPAPALSGPWQFTEAPGVEAAILNTKEFPNPSTQQTEHLLTFTRLRGTKTSPWTTAANLIFTMEPSASHDGCTDIVTYAGTGAPITVQMMHADARRYWAQALASRSVVLTTAAAVPK